MKNSASAATSASTPAPAPAPPSAAAASSGASEALNVIFDIFMPRCPASRASDKGVSASSVSKSGIVADSALEYDTAYFVGPVTAEDKPMLTEFIADPGSSRHVTNSRVGMKNYKLCNDYQLSTGGSGHSVTLRGRGDLDVASKSNSAENPGVFDTVIVNLKDVLHVPQVATILVSLRAPDADGLKYVGKGGMISMFGGIRRFLVEDRLYKIEGFPVTMNIRRKMEESGNFRMCDQIG